MYARSLVICTSLLVFAARTPAHAANAVTEWAAIVQQSIHNVSAPRSAGTSQVLHTMAMLAIYDAVMAIEGGYQPFAAAIDRAPGADLRAAVATAAFRAVRPRVVPSQWPAFDQQYAAYMAAIPDGAAKLAGVQIGEAAAAALLARRANDGFGNVVLYECSAAPPAPGEFEPDAGCPGTTGTPQPVDVKLAQVQPFVIARADQFRSGGPNELWSDAYTEDFVETRDYGRIDSTVRSPEQTDIAYFWSENPYVHWNRNLIALANAQQLDVRDTARLLALVHTTVSDAIIAGFEAKYHYAHWRPRTAIPRADADGNDDTDADQAWQPLLRVNHPEYPSGHGFWSTAVVESLTEFFGTKKVTWTLTTSKAAVPQLVQTERTYERLNELMREIVNARIWGGLHWRHSVRHGEQIGRKVAAWVHGRAFTPID